MFKPNFEKEVAKGGLIDYFMEQEDEILDERPLTVDASNEEQKTTEEEKSFFGQFQDEAGVPS